MNKPNISATLITSLIATLPAEEAKATMLALGFPMDGVKKSPNTLLADAINKGKARLNVQITIKPPYPNEADQDPYMQPVHQSKVYTYKDRKTTYGG